MIDPNLHRLEGQSPGTLPNGFNQKRACLTVQWREQQAEARRVDAAIEANLTTLGFSTERDSRDRSRTDQPASRLPR